MKRFISVIFLSSLFALPVMAAKVRAALDLSGDNLIVAKTSSELARNPSAHGLYPIRTEGNVVLLADNRILANKLQAVGDDLYVAQFQPKGEWAYVKPIDKGALAEIKRFDIASVQNINPFWEKMRLIEPTTCAQQWGRICEYDKIGNFDDKHSPQKPMPVRKF